MSPIDKSVIDEQKRFSDTVLWKLQKAFYEENAVKCWQECVVPNFVTSNCFIAHAYAKSILGFLRDYFGSDALTEEQRKEPIYIIEIGAGSAKLSYVLLQKLLALASYLPHEGCFKYVITDFTANNFDFWMNHPRFQELVEQGVVDFGQFDAEAGGIIRLGLAGTEIKAGAIKNPLLCVANYVFDTLKHDAFRINNGVLEEMLCNTTSNSELDTRNPDLLRFIKCTWTARACKGPCYEDPRLDAILQKFKGDYQLASFLMPVGAIKAIENLRQLADAGLVVLAGDKGYIGAGELEGLRDPHIAVHGSFSCMVNFRALHEFCVGEGGFVMHSGYLDGFKCSAMAFGMAQQDYPQFRMAYSEAVGQFGPDSFSTLQRCLKEESRSLSLRSALAVLRLSHFDPDVFYKFKQVFIDKGPYASEKLQNDIRLDVTQVYRYYFPLQPSKDVAFEAGRIFMGLKDFLVAADYFRDSQRYCGVHHVSWYNMGVCYFYLNELTQARECFDNSLELCSDYPDAIKWREKVSQVQDFLGGAAGTPQTADGVAGKDGPVEEGGPGQAGQQEE